MSDNKMKVGKLVFGPLVKSQDVGSNPTPKIPTGRPVFEQHPVAKWIDDIKDERDNLKSQLATLTDENQRLRELMEKYESCLQNFMVATAFVTEMRKGSEKAFAEPMRQREELRTLARLKKGKK